ncbi:metal-dependent hydrolase [Haloferula helveola]
MRKEMNTATHALAPLLIVHALGRSKWVARRKLWLVGLFGALPDLLCPHLSLDARMTSWSHGLPAWGGFTLALMVAVPLSRGWLGWRLAIACSLAYLLHLFCDAIAGGINWLYPVADGIWGKYWVPPIYWTPIDIVLVLTTYFVFRAIPRWRKSRARAAGEPLGEVGES